MTQIESVQAEIESLSSEDFARLAAWIAERDWQNWDRQIERDSAAGKLDLLREEVEATLEVARPLGASHNAAVLAAIRLGTFQASGM